MPERILIIEDDEAISELLDYNLRQAGFETVLAHDGEKGLHVALSAPPQLIILDVMLPGLDGWQVCRRIREHSQVPILFLTAKEDEFDRVLGLELGADDYVIKPFSPRELVARVKAVLRRVDGKASADSALHYEGLAIDRKSHEVSVDQSPVAVTPMEYQLLLILAANPGQVFSRKQLLRQVWGESFYGDQRTVDVHISHLREKLKGYGDRIQTVRGFGYKWKE